MSRSLNKLTIIGNVGQDPEIRVAQSGTKVANLRIATNEKWKDRDGKQQEHTEWHRVVFYGIKADIVESYVKRGDRLYVEGTLRTEKWQDRDGNDRYTTEVRGRELLMLGGDNARQDSGAKYTRTASPDQIGPDDLPF